MSERPGKSRPMPAAPFDDPSIPVLTERLTLPDLDLDFTLPVADEAPGRAPAHASPLPASPAVSAPPVAPPPPPLPRVLGAEFETDDWLVETIPLAPKPEFSLDLSTIHVPPLSAPAAVAPATVEPAAPALSLPTPSLPAPAPIDSGTASAAAPAPAPTPAPSALVADTGFAAADVVIPASLMRAPGAARDVIVAAPNPAPTFDQLPPSTTDTTVVPAVSVAPESPAPLASGAFAVPPAPPSGTHWTTLELELRESILRELAQRLPDDVETILRRQLAPAIDAAVGAAVGAATARLATEIRRAAGASLRDLVDHAVQSELARLRAQRTP
jgi:hypothetical protein